MISMIMMITYCQLKLLFVNDFDVTNDNYSKNDDDTFNDDDYLF